MFGHVAQREAMRMFVENTEILQGCSTTYKPEFVAPVVEVRGHIIFVLRNFWSYSFVLRVILSCVGSDLGSDLGSEYGVIYFLYLEFFCPFLLYLELFCLVGV